MNLQKRVTIDTHGDQIWTCHDKELAIKKMFQERGIPHHFIDIPDWYHDNEPMPQGFVTDLLFEDYSTDQYNWTGPSYWHIYLLDKPVTQEVIPTYRMNALMNRVAPDRQRLLYRIYQHNLHENSIISYNAQGDERYYTHHGTIEQRRNNFKNTHPATASDEAGNAVYAMLVNKIPLTIPYHADRAAMLSLWTIVPETYSINELCGFSEKIFRALQTPRPWVLWHGQGGVHTLRKAGFDVMDDLIDHSYDTIRNPDERQTAMLMSICNNTKNYNQMKDRCYRAAEANRELLMHFERKWPAQLEKLLQGTSSSNQS